MNETEERSIEADIHRIARLWLKQGLQQVDVRDLLQSLRRTVDHDGASADLRCAEVILAGMDAGVDPARF
ncbi:MAG TPA: hypothetical protein VNS22_13325 [Geminicoccus sp.]|uniref:hypothetical protein n=1 Tax=Geminicoccus sp. TaxID=2024832 RepID=UPI002BD68F54|nr:hypothetical protein [Geminicoccus sp.]HWL69348.1 hypothetical protein [Geminicoccus sp.]